MDSFDRFLERLAEPTSAPGGGAASASVSIVASALVSMVAGITVGKKGHEQDEEQLKGIIRRSAELRDELKMLMDEDEIAFNDVVRAWKLPKSTEEEKKKRSTAISVASMGAIRTPWKIASLSQEILRQAELLTRIGIKSAITDAGCAMEFTHASIRGAIENIRINLKSIKDQSILESENIKISVFLEDTEEVYRRGMKNFEAGMV